MSTIHLVKSKGLILSRMQHKTEDRLQRQLTAGLQYAPRDLGSK